jgi:hypothetical protein
MNSETIYTIGRVSNGIGGLFLISGLGAFFYGHVNDLTVYDRIFTQRYVNKLTDISAGFYGVSLLSYGLVKILEKPCVQA